MSDLKKNLIALATGGNTPAEKKPGGLAGALGAGKPKAKSPLSGQWRISGVADDTVTMLNDTSKTRSDEGYLGYIIDATASRERTWNTAQQIQKDMFMEIARVGNLWARVAAFRGGMNGHSREIVDLGWKNKAQDIVSQMEPLTCRAGETNIRGAVEALISGKQDFIPNNIVMIGDCCEEVESIVIPAAKKLKEMGIQVFAFHEGNDMVGERIYRAFAEITGGAFEKFSPRMPLKDLCTAVGVYTVGKEDALREMMKSSDAAKAIGRQILAIEGPKGPKGANGSTPNLPKPR